MAINLIKGEKSATAPLPTPNFFNRYLDFKKEVIHTINETIAKDEVITAEQLCFAQPIIAWGKDGEFDNHTLTSIRRCFFTIDGDYTDDLSMMALIDLCGLCDRIINYKKGGNDAE